MWQYNHAVCGSDELYHWGIKGMKWGVRRYQNKDGSLTPAGKKRYSQNDSPSEDYVRAHTKKPISQMSDQELRTVNNRLQMENQYRQLTASPSKMQKAMKKVAAVTAALGTLGGLAAAMEKAPGNIDKIINNGQKMAEKFSEMVFSPYDEKWLY